MNEFKMEFEAALENMSRQMETNLNDIDSDL